MVRLELGSFVTEPTKTMASTAGGARPLTVKEKEGVASTTWNARKIPGLQKTTGRHGENVEFLVWSVFGGCNFVKEFLCYFLSDCRGSGLRDKCYVCE